jgi:hypothetical protein
VTNPVTPESSERKLAEECAEKIWGEYLNELSIYDPPESQIVSEVKRLIVELVTPLIVYHSAAIVQETLRRICDKCDEEGYIHRSEIMSLGESK